MKIWQGYRDHSSQREPPWEGQTLTYLRDWLACGSLLLQDKHARDRHNFGPGIILISAHRWHKCTDEHMSECMNDGLYVFKSPGLAVNGRNQAEFELISSRRHTHLRVRRAPAQAQAREEA